MNEIKVKTLSAYVYFSRNLFDLFMLKITHLHHIALICSDYQRSKQFYTSILGLTIIREVYREEKRSFKLDLALTDHYVIELFSFPESPARVSNPEACGLRHLAFSTTDLAAAREYLLSNHIVAEEIRYDEYTGKRFFFFRDPDQLPLEMYEE